MLAIATIAMVACRNDATAPAVDASVSVSVSNAAIAANPNNVLSAIATFEASGADSVRVVSLAADGGRIATPFTHGAASDSIVLLGLRPATAYQMLIEASGGDTIITSDTLAFTTDPLPTFLQATSLQSSVPSSGGYILTAVGDSTVAYAVAFDSTGAVSWYHEFAEGVPAGEIKQQVNGNITVFVGATHGGEPVPGRYVELSPAGDLVRTFTAQSPAYTDDHELWLLFRDDTTYDGALFFTNTQRQLDLSAQGGPSDTLVSGHQLVRQNADGSQQVVFDAWDHFSIADEVEPIGNEPDYDHPNSISIAPDGNYVVSWRNLDAITKIDATTGAIIWTLAAPWSALHSDFTIVGDPLGGFSAQHSVRVVGTDDILVFDNGTLHTPHASRAVEYRLDDSAKTATMTFQYQRTPPFYTQFTGSVQRLANGNTLIGWTWFTSPLIATEVTSEGDVVWEGTLKAPGPALPYRFTKIASLYRYVQP
ncbi:MAG TPA: aryl-sulfate sulfotransferase [Gemmatimonadaceae bacterium]|nr:aryl-sulfate sulfotransferase [Gemmatimonadaceae bacterium]